MKYMFANHPKIAKEFAQAMTHGQVNMLPQKASKKNKKVENYHKTRGKNYA